MLARSRLLRDDERAVRFIILKSANARVSRSEDGDARSPSILEDSSSRVSHLPKRLIWLRSGTSSSFNELALSSGATKTCIPPASRMKLYVTLSRHRAWSSISQRLLHDEVRKIPRREHQALARTPSRITIRTMACIPPKFRMKIWSTDQVCTADAHPQCKAFVAPFWTKIFP